MEIEEPEWINPQADYWKQHCKDLAIRVKQTEMKKIVPFPRDVGVELENVMLDRDEENHALPVQSCR
ncbi:hypothetical protein ACJRO7_017125 [Eucalyptus globulus]|uniref:Uncharacterized protein n=1 Tax=Eucalyptus globulus TaxID=34317 RepID=A0ABD3KWA8_EUCGL